MLYTRILLKEILIDQYFLKYFQASELLETEYPVIMCKKMLQNVLISVEYYYNETLIKRFLREIRRHEAPFLC